MWWKSYVREKIFIAAKELSDKNFERLKKALAFMKIIYMILIFIIKTKLKTTTTTIIIIKIKVILICIWLLIYW